MHDGVRAEQVLIFSVLGSRRTEVQKQFPDFSLVVKAAMGKAAIDRPKLQTYTRLIREQQSC